jgi:lipooligosaccharide transport system permease protein
MNKSSWISDMVTLPTFGIGITAIWRRNFLVFRHTFAVNVAWIFVEPLMYVLALGYGLGFYISEINGQNYSAYIAPSMMATAGMFIAYFEGTYATFTKLTIQHTYQTIVITPLDSDEIVLGEILWITSKAMISVMSVGIVFSAMGLLDVTRLLPSWAVLALMCWVFAALGVLLATYATSFEWFSYAQSGVIIPMSLFCGTYFPIERLPNYLKYFAYTLPLTHGLESVRMFSNDEFHSQFFINIMYLLFVGLILTNLACARLRRKIVL